MSELVRDHRIHLARRELGQQRIGDHDPPRTPQPDDRRVGFGCATREVERTHVSDRRSGAIHQGMDPLDGGGVGQRLHLEKERHEHVRRRKNEERTDRRGKQAKGPPPGGAGGDDAPQEGAADERPYDGPQRGCLQPIDSPAAT